ncbi:unnamed protein product, partial [Didymodactylos carnosus]
CSLGEVDATFDDLTPTTSIAVIPPTYDNLTWTNGHYLYAASYPSSGYPLLVTSGSYTGWYQGNSMLTIQSISNTDTFIFNEVYMIAGWTPTLTTLIAGYYDSTQLYNQTVTLTQTSKYLFIPNWSGINKITMYTAGAATTYDVGIENLKITYCSTATVTPPASTAQTVKASQATPASYITLNTTATPTQPACAFVNVSNLLVNPGAETGLLSPWVIDGTSAPGIDNGTFDASIKPHSGGYQFGGFSGQAVTLTQNIVISGTQGITPALIDSCKLAAHISFWEQGLNQGANNDDAQVILAFLDVNNVLLQNISTPEVDFSA